MLCVCWPRLWDLQNGWTDRDGPLAWATGTMYQMVPWSVITQEKGQFLGIVRIVERHRELLQRCTQNWLNRSRIRDAVSGGDLYDPKEPCIKRGQGRTNPFAAARGVTRQRCGLLSKFFYYLFFKILTSLCRQRNFAVSVQYLWCLQRPSDLCSYDKPIFAI